MKQNKHKLVAVLACRNQGNRLYGKPLHFLDKKNQIRVIDQIIFALKKIINFLDKNSKYKKLISKYTLNGYKTMYL